MCAQSYMVQSKIFFDHFICFWKWFLSLFVFMFSVYFVFHCLNMFFIEKTGVRVFCGSAGDSPVASSSRSFWRLTRGLLATHSRLAKILATEPRDSPSCEMPRNSFLKGFLWETCFKHLSSSLKPFFQYFYI